MSFDSLELIKRNLKLTLEELEINYCKNISFNKAKLIEVVKSMPNLRILSYFDLPNSKISAIRKKLPNVVIKCKMFEFETDENCVPPMDGFWEIKVKQIEMFPMSERAPGF